MTATKPKPRRRSASRGIVVYVVGIFRDGKLDGVASVNSSRQYAEAYVEQYNRFSTLSGLVAKIRKGAVQWPGDVG